jgi:Dolichyl-phosphate-mannose-protein mannosyltransferase
MTAPAPPTESSECKVRTRVTLFTAVALAVTVVVAAVLRFWRIDWGLAANSPFFDELIFTTHAANFVPLSWHSFGLTGFIYPSLYGDIAGIATVIAHAMGWIEATPTPKSPGIILTARVVSAAIGVATVGMIYQAARRMYSPMVGVGAAALMAVAPFHAMYAHIASTDITLTAASALVLLGSYALARHGTISLAMAAGLAAGLAFASKYTGLAMIVPVGWAVIENAIAARSAGRALVLGIAALVGFALTFAAACTPCVLHAAQVVAAMQHEQLATSVFAGGSANNVLVPSLGWYGRPYLYELCASLPYALGWPLYAVSLAGIVVAARRRELADRIVLSGILPYFAFMGSQQVVFPRYLLPLFPGVIVLAGRALLAANRWPRVRGALFATVWIYSLSLTATQVARFSRDQQAAVARWIAQQSSPLDLLLGKVRVAVPDYPLDYFGLAVPLAKAKLITVSVADGHWFDQPVDAFIMPEWYAIAIRRDEPKGPASRDLRRLESGRAGYHLVARWRSSYVQRDFYTWLDPAFAAGLWQGEIGFDLYARGH